MIVTETDTITNLKTDFSILNSKYQRILYRAKNSRFYNECSYEYERYLKIYKTAKELASHNSVDDISSAITLLTTNINAFDEKFVCWASSKVPIIF